MIPRAPTISLEAQTHPNHLLRRWARSPRGDMICLKAQQVRSVGRLTSNNCELKAPEKPSPRQTQDRPCVEMIGLKLRALPKKGCAVHVVFLATASLYTYCVQQGNCSFCDMFCYLFLVLCMISLEHEMYCTNTVWPRAQKRGLSRLYGRVRAVPASVTYCR